MPWVCCVMDNGCITGVSGETGRVWVKPSSLVQWWMYVLLISLCNILGNGKQAIFLFIFLSYSLVRSPFRIKMPMDQLRHDATYRAKNVIYFFFNGIWRYETLVMCRCSIKCGVIDFGMCIPKLEIWIFSTRECLFFPDVWCDQMLCEGIWI